MTRIEARHITRDNFSAFGRVVKSPTGTPTAEDETFRYWSELASYHVDGDTEIGLCTVFLQEGRPVTWMERHELTPELLIPIDQPFILPVMRAEAGPDAVEAFRVDVGEAVVIGPNIWHSACQPVGADSATYFVIFRKGTPAEDVYKTDLADVCLA